MSRRRVSCTSRWDAMVAVVMCSLLTTSRSFKVCCVSLLSAGLVVEPKERKKERKKESRSCENDVEKVRLGFNQQN